MLNLKSGNLDGLYIQETSALRLTMRVGCVQSGDIRGPSLTRPLREPDLLQYPRLLINQENQELQEAKSVSRKVCYPYSGMDWLSHQGH